MSSTAKKFLSAACLILAFSIGRHFSREQLTEEMRENSSLIVDGQAPVPADAFAQKETLANNTQSGSVHWIVPDSLMTLKTSFWDDVTYPYRKTWQGARKLVD